MSNPELLENKTKQKGKYTKPVPRIMSLTWLRLHMKFFIYAVVAAFVVSLFFIGYGTRLQSNEEEKQKYEYNSRIKEDFNKSYALPSELEAMANETVINGNYGNASFSINVKSFYNELVNARKSILFNRNMNEFQKGFFLNTPTGVNVIKDEIAKNLIKSNIISAYAKSTGLVSNESLEIEANNYINQRKQSNNRQFEEEMFEMGCSNTDEFKETYKLQQAVRAANNVFLSKDRIAVASASEEYYKAYYENNKYLFKKDDEVSFEHLLVAPSDLVESLGIDDNQVDNYYNSHKSDYMSLPQVEAYHIYIKDNASAAEILEGVRNNYLTNKKEESFIEAVKQYSQGGSSSNQGKLPVFYNGEITEDYNLADSVILKDELCDGGNLINSQIEEAVFGKDKSTLPFVTNVIKTDNGHHLLLVKNYLDPKVLPLSDSLKTKIKTTIAKEKAENEEAEKIARKLLTDNPNASIEDMAKAYGHDSGNNHVYSGLSFSIQNNQSFDGLGGYGIYSDDGRTYLPEFYNAIQTAIKENKLNTYVEPFKTASGWNILKVTSYKTGLYEPFENCRDVIRRIVTLEPSDAEINEYFEQNRSRFDIPARRTIRQIVCGKERADFVYNELKKGAAFAMLAKKYSTDFSASSGGMVPPVVKGTFTNFNAKLEEAIWNSKIGELSAPIETNRGYYIILVENESAEVKATAQKFSNEIKRILGSNYQQEAISYFVDGLEKQANVVKNQELINKINFKKETEEK